MASFEEFARYLTAALASDLSAEDVSPDMTLQEAGLDSLEVLEIQILVADLADQSNEAVAELDGSRTSMREIYNLLKRSTDLASSPGSS